jgi:hypothetical protein
MEGETVTDDPPVTKYRFEWTVDANTHEEIADAIEALHVNLWQRLDGRDELEIWSSDRSTTRLHHLNPEMTPQRYDTELREWLSNRKESRR